jgi:group I intron endonuclease
MSGNYHGNKMASRFGVIIDGKLRFSRWVRNKIGSMKKEEVLKHYPDAIFVPQYRKQRYFNFIGNKRENRENKKTIKHLSLPYPKRDSQISGTIYLITNTINQKKYIGQTIRSFQDRIHEYELRLCNDYLKNSFNKYGFDKFKFEIIDTANDLDELNLKEIKYIKEFGSNIREFGYNLESGGRNSIPSTETLEKMSKSHLGIKQNEEWINKRVHKSGSDEAKKYGKRKTKKEKEHLSKASPKYWEGKTRDEETKRKISETKIAQGLSPKQKEVLYKKVYAINIKTNEIVEYESTTIASEDRGVNQSTISRWCSGEKTKNGVLWKY